MKNKFSMAMTLAVVLAMLVTSLALADQVNPDGDLVTAGDQTSIALGNVTPGQIINRSISFALECKSNKHADDLQRVNISFQAVGSGSSIVRSGGGVFSGASLSAGNTTIGPESGTIPTAWPDDGTNCGGTLPIADNGDSSVTITAPTTPGSYTYNVRYGLSLSPAGTDDSNSLNPNQTTVSFTLTVLSNTSPSISVTGVTNGASYEFGSVPSAGCSVTDAEDGNSTFAASLSSITGPLSAYGLGSQTASCSYTDGGGLSASASATYSIVDTTDPTIDAHGDETVEASSSSGAIVNYTSPATHDAVFGDGVASCAPASGGTFALGNTTVTCNASDGAGNAATPTTFVVHVVDTIGPSIDAHGDETAEATGPGGANVSYTSPATHDAVDGDGVATCAPASGSLFPLGDTTVTCNATDTHGNAATATTFDVHVVDTTDPTIADNADMTVEGNTAGGANVTYSNPAASDIVDTSVDVVCAPASGSFFALGGPHTVNCTATDDSGNSSTSSFDVTVVDTTDPIIAFVNRTPANSYGWNNGDVTVNWSCTDIVGVVSNSVSQTVSAEGANQSVTGTCTDTSGNTASDIQTGINIDKTAPSVNASASPAPNANGWNKTNVTVSFNGTDGLSGIASCDANVVLSSEGADQSASGSCTDKAGNTASATASNIDIDKTAPTVSLVGGPANGGTYYFGLVPAAPTCTASDSLSGLDGSCSVTGYSTAIGGHTVAASATDKAGNSNSASATYTVLAWTISGFYQPVDMSPAAPATIVWNTVKGGSTVPLKFEVFAGATELTNTAIVSAFSKQVACGIAGPEDTIEVLATGGTSLRYDTVGGQFIYNWQTPKLPGKCYAVTMTTQDGSSITAYFKLK